MNFIQAINKLNEKGSGYIYPETCECERRLKIGIDHNISGDLMLKVKGDCTFLQSTRWKICNTTFSYSEAMKKLLCDKKCVRNVSWPLDKYLRPYNNYFVFSKEYYDINGSITIADIDSEWEEFFD